MFLQKYLGGSQIIGCIDADGLDIGNTYLDTVAGRQPTQLFQTLGLLKRCLREFSYGLKDIGLECIESDMLVISMT